MCRKALQRSIADPFRAGRFGRGRAMRDQESFFHRFDNIAVSCNNMDVSRHNTYVLDGQPRNAYS
jgi:hypothetical protein